MEGCKSSIIIKQEDFLFLRFFKARYDTIINMKENLARYLSGESLGTFFKTISSVTRCNSFIKDCPQNAAVYFVTYRYSF
jgi:hypothetical protein